MHRIVVLCNRIAGTRRFLALTFGVILANALVIGLQTYDKVEAESWGRCSTSSTRSSWPSSSSS